MEKNSEYGRRPKRSASSGSEPTPSAGLFSVLYQELKGIARSRMKSMPPGQTLQTTALVHEAYLKLLNHESSSSDHFMAVAAQAMRNVIVDAARSKLTAKRGGEFRRVKLGDSELALDAPDVLAVDDALTLLEASNAEAAAVIKLRYFGGCDLAETAALLGLSESTVDRRWRYARAWMQRHLEVEE